MLMRPRPRTAAPAALTHLIPGYAAKGWPHDRDLPPIGILPEYRTDEHKHGPQDFMLIDVRSGLIGGGFGPRETAAHMREMLREKWPDGVFVMLQIPADEPWFVPPNDLHMCDQSLTRAYGHPPIGGPLWGDE
jgi:hypothetical protein